AADGGAPADASDAGAPTDASDGGSPVDADAAPACSVGLDPTFGTQGVVQTQLPNGFQFMAPNTVLVQPDGKTVIFGANVPQTPATVVARFDANGALDSTFGTAGIANVSPSSNPMWAFALAQQADGKLLVGGQTGSAWFLARLGTNGALDTTFGTGG